MFHLTRAPRPAPLLVLLLGGCAASLKSPTPSAQTLAPALACDAQVTTTVTIDGANFTPVPTDVLGTPTLALPSILATRTTTLDGTADPADGVPLDGTSRWVDASAMVFDVTPEQALPPGVYDVSITNVDGQSTTLTGSLAITPPPSLTSAVANLVCDQQSDVVIVLTGEFHVIDGVYPTVTVGGQSLTPDTMGDCVDFVGPVAGSTCRTLDVTIPEGSLAADVYGVTVTDPATSTCASVEDVRIEVIAAPTLDNIVPNLECVDQAEQSFTLTGTGFLVLDGTAPTVAFGAYAVEARSVSGCTPLSGPAGGELCTSLEFAIPAGGAAPGVADVIVTNPAPADCHTEESVQAELVPAPTIASVDPALVCTEDGSRVLAIAGTGFVVLADGTLPTVWFDDVPLGADVADGCTPLAGPAGGQSCAGLTVTVPPDTVAPGLHGVTVQNPDPAECITDTSVPFEVVVGPTLDAATPILACDDEADTIYVLTGADFAVVDGVYPDVSIGAWTGAASAADGCTSLDGSVAGSLCTSLTVVVPTGALADGTLAVSVADPAPVSCISTDLVTVDVIGAPQVSALSPATACEEAGAFTLTISGQDFAFVDGLGPTVTIGGTPYAVTGSGDCTTLTSSGAVVCGTLTVDVPAGAFPGVGAFPVAITNPDPVACTSGDAASFNVTGPPTIVSVAPPEVCETGAIVTVTGTNFDPSAVVIVDGITLPTTWDSSTELLADTTGVPAGTWDVTVSNGDGCDATLADALLVDPPPIVFYVDPPVTWSGIAMRATIYVSGVNHDVVDVSLVDSAGDVTPLDFAYDPTRSYRILATLPAGLPDDSYTVVVNDGVDCEARLEDAVQVVSELTVALSDVDPPFGYTGGTTAVNVNAIDPAPSGQVQFEELPRVYLSPHDVTTDSVATELSALSWIGATQLDAVVPAGLDVGDYDVLVINPDGSVGELDAAFTVTADPVPAIDSVSPASVDNSVDHDLTITGAAFRDASVSFDCETYGGGATTSVAGTVVGSATGDSLTATFPSSTLSPGVCLVTATNVDGTYASYASVSVTAPSANLDGFQSGPSMSVGRRAPAASAGRATRTARYLYAIGGDAGASSSPLDSIEAIDVGVYGEPGDWETLPGRLPVARTLAGIGRVGRFLYVAGGNDGSTTRDDVIRAEVLDPTEAPVITDVNLAYAEAGGLGGGTWIYRVAALYPSTWATNPGGESLPGDPLVARLPSVTDGFALTLTWSADANASGYRVYRIPAADTGSGTEEWLADVSGETTTSWTDDGTGATDPTRSPLPKGALGEWATVATLPVAVESPCVTIGPDPTDSAVSHLYVAGGRDASGTVRSEISWVPITEVDEHEQSVGAAQTSTRELSTARWQCGAFPVTSDLDSVVTGRTSWMYFGGGLTTGGSVSTAVDAGLIGAGGDFADFQAVDDMRSSAGYGYAAASNFLYVFGGSNGSPSTDGVSGEICGSSSDPGCSRSPIDPPDLRNWNSLGLSLNDARYLPGSAQESSVIFLVGGQSDTAAASATVEYTNY